MTPRDTPLTRLPGRWYELTVTAPRDREDPLVALLHADGAIGARTSPAGPARVRLSAWFDRRPAAERALERLAALEWAHLAEPPLRDVTDPGWLEAAAERSKPLRAGRFIVVESEDGAAARAEPGGGITVVVPRGRAFGTGEHATTALCLEALSDAPRSGAPSVDLGTGSGILAIAAALDGRGPVVAIDNDPAVLDVARANVNANGVSGSVDVRGGSWTDLPRDGVLGLLLANIHRTTLVRAASRGVAALAPGGVAILSGFPPDDAPLVERAWRDAGATGARVLTRGEWAALILARAR